MISLYSCRQAVSVRNNQKIRLFLLGILFFISPSLLLTVLPTVLGLPYVPASITLISSIFFPLFLIYSVLRYQILILDSYVRRTVSYIIAIVCLALFIFLIVALCGIFFSQNITIYTVSGIVVLTAVASPNIWRVAQLITERVFFKDVRYYRRLMESPNFFTDEALDIEEASALITSVALHTFEIAQACLFVFEESGGYYRVLPACSSDPTDTSRKALLRSILNTLKPSVNNGPPADWLEAEHLAVRRLSVARRPMLLSEVIRPENSQPGLLERFLMVESPLGDEDWLLAPLRAQGRLIGILVLGERNDRQHYAGPDFEVAQLLTARFSSVLETARMYERASQHSALLNNLYPVSTMPGSTFKTVEEAAQVYALTVARAIAAQAEIWRYDSQDALMRYSVSAGQYPDLFVATEKDTCLVSDSDWVTWFFDGDVEADWMQAGAPTCLLRCSRRPEYSLAWLPLQKNGHRLGVLLLLYPRPHRFHRMERRVLEMFADQCSTTLENVQMTLDLLNAYERQKELDVLKDQFVTTTSHELRTPLTTVQGYIELLCEHKNILPLEMLIEFAEKARLGCDELALLVGNIVDASTIRADIKSIQRRSVSLLQAVRSVLDILEANFKREERRVLLSIEPDLFVAADRVRLCQVVLNLLNNALCYSPEGTPIEISAEPHAKQVQLAIRDYGSGVAPEHQACLFERFVRLERDMNSAVRGAGLGLYLSKQLIEAMGGRIWIESSGEPGKGSIFLFELQLAPQDRLAGSLLLPLPV